jgi:hypothetical protein
MFLLEITNMATKTHVVKVTGVPTEMLRLLDERAQRQHFGGRAEYIRELIRRDVLSEAAYKPASVGVAKTTSEAESVFARIEARDMSGVEPLAPGADSRDAIYGDRA